MKYNKLIRDRIPEIMRTNNQKPILRKLDESSYKIALLDKLIEEAQELKEANGDIGERADVAEVLRAIDKVFNISEKDLQKRLVGKREKRGAFEKRLYLESVE